MVNALYSALLRMMHTFRRFYNTFRMTIWNELTRWGAVTRIFVGNLTITASDNGLSPGQRQTIIWPNLGYCSFGA